MIRRQNFQNLSWFYDLYKRSALDLDPPYQRRSVWNDAFKAYFIDTVLLNYPAPAIFLYEEISAEGTSMYHVVDGKQRITTILEFVQGKFAVGEKSELTALRGKYFEGLDENVRREFWSYQLLVEYIPTNDEGVINSIFDRINRNVAKLTAQELRHARLDGEFIQLSEQLSEWQQSVLPANFPRFAAQSRKQMKDVEFTALLLLLLEEGPRGYSQDDLDKAFADRDSEWEARVECDARYRAAISYIAGVLAADEDLAVTRLRNQADFYAVFGAIDSLQQDGQLGSAEQSAAALRRFVDTVDLLEAREADLALANYFDAARSASNDKGPRETRVRYMRSILAVKQA
ncbi:DUF262 domain-containing protein [Burkholderia dolosa]|uniref:DUF262 domain-containing protein n=1 Tax=Burkholderia dolosa TaxID=152500 RepID=A0A892IIB1_9BURK|nr:MULTISPECIES: DUF262 domain-containing protein [Burkholderia]AYZ95894.1 DUF262 domain-containing protein [Burkholderia dolosa]MBR8418767.1 DUF262 domain-containing protein [Burkholderia dolosa]MBY4657836.1 DUF262 domain-containing protein [Burkholderia dolosa]MBY4688414.1 DUF262 domain-containing protein [Burkholderia dolosa]MBY4780689.1 DUF262 domain-containing protein [Burkholderia dolosa]